MSASDSSSLANSSTEVSVFLLPEVSHLCGLFIGGHLVAGQNPDAYSPTWGSSVPEFAVRWEIGYRGSVLNTFYLTTTGWRNGDSF